MIKFSTDASNAWKRARIEVPYIVYERPEWNPKHSLKHKLPRAHDHWTTEQWNSSGFPSVKLPKSIPTMLKADAWNNILHELEDQYLISPYQKRELQRVKSWLKEGVPFRMEGSGTKHHLNQQETRMAIDKIAQFCKQRHMAGPIHKWKRRRDLRFISTFARYQASDNSVRIINDHSQPQGHSFNEAIDENVVKELPIHVGQLREFIDNMLRCGKNAIISKYDMTSAYKFIPISKEKYRLQAIMLCGDVFIDMKLSYGDASACHYYSFFHQLVQDAFVFNTIQTPKSLVTICIDDSTIVVPQECKKWAAEYGERYKFIMKEIGAGTKNPDPLKLKCFELETSGEVLGAWLDSSNLTWSLSDSKLANILEQIDLIIDPKNVKTIKVVKLKTLQQVIGKIGALAGICTNLNSAMSILNIEKARFEKAFSDENKLSGRMQHKTVFLSQRARDDLIDIRAVLVCLKEYPMLLESYKKQPKLSSDLYFCGDASGQTDILNPAAIGVFIPRQTNVEAYALSYIMPREWLMSRDWTSRNYDNTMLLELLSLITPMVEFPQIFRDKTIHFQTDNLALSQLYRSMWPIREPTAYFLRALNFVTQAMNINLEITWRKRKTDIFSKVADDLTHSNFTAVSGLVRNRRVSTRAVSSFLGALCQESF